MKLMFLLNVTAFLQATADIKAQSITLNANNITLGEVMMEIQKQRGYSFFFRGDYIASTTIKANVKNADLKTAMATILAGHKLSWLLKERTIIIKATGADPNIPNADDTDHRQRTVTGRVVDDDNKPLEGITVRVKGSNFASNTNINGNYRIILPPDHQTLVFSMIGFETQEHNVNEQNNLNVILKTVVSDLDEVLVVGYGEVSRKDITGSVGEVSMTDMEKAPVLSFEQALAGRVAGVQVSSADGQPGNEGVNIVIRGANSLTQSNSPLYVIDGFPIEDPNNAAINPQDIQSINILKDASATAIYGARGANGVVVIETKKGEEGRPVISYNNLIGLQYITKRMDVMDPHEFVKYQLELSPVSSAERYLSDGRTLESYQQVEGYDWQGGIFRNALFNNHNIALRGGTKQTRYSISGSLNNQEGVIINTGQNRYQGRIQLEQNISHKLKTGVILNYSRLKDHGKMVSSSGGSNATNYLLYGVWAYRPIGSLTDDGQFGDLIDELIDPEVNSASDFRINPIISAENEFRQRTTKNLSGNIYLNYDVNQDLVLRINAGINSIDERNDVFYNSNTNFGTPLLPQNNRGSYGSVNYFQSETWTNENTLTWKKKVNSMHVFDAVAGTTIQGRKNSQYGFSSQLVPNEELGINGLGEGNPYLTNSIESENILLSFFGRVNYNLNSRYLFTATFRSDGSSKFSADNRWGFFPSGAFAWRVKREKFMKNLAFISDAKLRVSYGITGNNRVNDFAYLPLLGMPQSSAYSFGNATPIRGVRVTSMGNEELKWESTEQLDLGYDLELFEGQFSVQVDVYNKLTYNLLLDADLPTTTGFRTAYKNVGRIRNRGLEFSFNSTNIQNENFLWETSFNISFNRNKILALTEKENILSSIPWQTQYENIPLYIARVGHPAAMYYGLIWEGNYQYEDFDRSPSGTYVLKNNVPANGNSRSSIQPGDIKYRDVNRDGQVNQEDNVIIGNPMPNHIGGVVNNFRYKGLDLHIFLQWSYGQEIYNANRMIFEGNILGSPGVNRNQFASYINRWQPDNPNNEIPRSGGAGPIGVYSSRVVEDGSFIRLKTVSLSYSLPVVWLSSMHISRLSVNISAQNLVTWSGYSGMDPEVSVRNTVLTPGFDFSAYPRAKSVIFGLKAEL